MPVTRVLSLAALLAAMVATGAGETAGTEPAAANAEFTATSKGVCKSAFDAAHIFDTLPNGPVYMDNPPFSAVTINKPCRGAVSALFTVFVRAMDDGQYVIGGIDARCLGRGGHAGGCKKGDTATGQPSQFFVAGGPDAVATFTIDTVFEDMKPGKWRFFVRLGGGDNTDVQMYRLTVEAFEGG